jgi:hypothetical protein
MTRFLHYKLMLRAVIVAQVAKPARLQENATSSGRFGNLRYVGPRNLSYKKSFIRECSPVSPMEHSS